MEPNYYQQNQQSSTNSRGYFASVLIAIVLLCVVFLALTWFGYGHLHIDAPAGARITVNGHAVQENELKLRPGSYLVGIQTAKYYSSYKTVKVSLFLKNNYKPTLAERTASSVISASSPDFQGLAAEHPIWQGNNSWLVAISGRGGANVVVSHYVNNHWVLVYTSGHPSTTVLPPAVENSVTQLTEELRVYN